MKVFTTLAILSLLAMALGLFFGTVFAITDDYVPLFWVWLTLGGFGAFISSFAGAAIYRIWTGP